MPDGRSTSFRAGNSERTPSGDVTRLRRLLRAHSPFILGEMSRTRYGPGQFLGVLRMDHRASLVGYSPRSPHR